MSKPHYQLLTPGDSMTNHYPTCSGYGQCDCDERERDAAIELLREAIPVARCGEHRDISRLELMWSRRLTQDEIPLVSRLILGGRDE